MKNLLPSACNAASGQNSLTTVMPEVTDYGGHHQTLCHTRETILKACMLVIVTQVLFDYTGHQNLASDHFGTACSVDVLLLADSKPLKILSSYLPCHFWRGY